MESLQREIEDERKAKLQHFSNQTGVGSLSCWGSVAGQTMSGVDFGTVAKIFSHEPVPLLKNRMPPLFSEHVMQEVINARGRETRRVNLGLREHELEWRHIHATELRQYENEWVVLEGEEIVAHGLNAADVIRQAKSSGIRIPYIFFVESESDDIVRIGL